MYSDRSFASDNNAGVHPEIMKAIEAANAGHMLAYGDDPFTARAIERFRETFGDDIEVFFVFGGTAANVLGLKALTEPHNAVICAETAHINVDECGAPERFTGCKLLTVSAPDGKLTVDQIARHVSDIGDQHRVQPRVVSITQVTELGTVYTLDEIRAIADYAHGQGMALHMDGARIANAAVYLGVELRETTRGAGVDVLSFGGTKNGMMFGEAVVFFSREAARQFQFIRKQGMQLASKMRFIAVQFDALLSNDLWRRNAAHSNAMANLLAQEMSHIPRVKITQEVQSNAVFAAIPAHSIAPLQQQRYFYAWNEETSEVRWMSSFDTTEEDVRAFAQLMGEALA